jgi:hypothetical protein
MGTRSKPTFKACDLKRAVQVLQDVGLSVTGARIAADGTIEVLTASPPPVLSSDPAETALERWEREHGQDAA